MTGTDLNSKMERLADVALSIGVNLQRGQELIVAGPVEAVDLIRCIASRAYRMGCGAVHVNYMDDQLTKILYTDGDDACFDRSPAWRFAGMVRALSEGAAYLRVFSADPNLLAGFDPNRQARKNKADSTAGRELMKILGGFHASWSIIPHPHPAWAKAVFPGLDEASAVAKLWEAIFDATRVSSGDAVANWRDHIAQIHSRTETLNGKQYEALHFRGPGTDLRVGLVKDHIWVGATTTTSTGITCLPNIPTEEVFTMPHRENVEGVVCASKPLSYSGNLIEGISVRFEKGRIVEANAKRGQDIFRNLIGTDDGAGRLGEVALVPHASPISQSGLLFLNTLFDENAASHIAIGRSYEINVPEGRKEVSLGANDSLVHVDWMIGSDKMDVDGVKEDGTVEALMRAGEFV